MHQKSKNVQKIPKSQAGSQINVTEAKVYTDYRNEAEHCFNLKHVWLLFA